MKPRLIAVAVIAGGLSWGAAVNLVAAPLPQNDHPAVMDKADRETTQKIRKALIEDKTLSTYAHNVKIIVQGGNVTLRGPVRSDTEKEAVAEKAATVAGAGNVTNELTIQPPK